ncbi:MAG: hypothetical protein PVJ57_19070 [Phycisphaerae bacterium]|jgi:hypothetical protein
MESGIRKTRWGHLLGLVVVTALGLGVWQYWRTRDVVDHAQFLELIRSARLVVQDDVLDVSVPIKACVGTHVTAYIAAVRDDADERMICVLNDAREVVYVKRCLLIVWGREEWYTDLDADGRPELTFTERPNARFSRIIELGDQVDEALVMENRSHHTLMYPDDPSGPPRLVFLYAGETGGIGARATLTFNPQPFSVVRNDPDSPVWEAVTITGPWAPAK